MKHATPFLLLFSLWAWGHSTNITHPVVSLEAIRQIQHYDTQDGKGYYRELYLQAQTNEAVKEKLGLDYYPYYWGIWNTPDWLKKIYDELKIADSEGESVTDPNPYPTIYLFNRHNVVTGVVREDHPVSKTVSHFYHAYTGRPLEMGGLPLGGTSRSMALKFLVESANIYGYESFPYPEAFDPEDWLNVETLPRDKPFSKKLAFQSFGEALHHLQDMNSVAHVQNDAHLTLDKAENEGYEAAYIPSSIFKFHGGVDINNWFVNARTQTQPATITSIDDIWPQPATQIDWSTESLARKVYNASVFKAALVLPAAYVGYGNVYTTSPSPELLHGSGELHDMFGDKLAWKHDDLFTLPYWNIEGVGKWKYLENGPDSNDQWWPVGTFGGPECGPDNEQCLEEGSRYYYIEQELVKPFDSAVDEEPEPVLTLGMRKDLFKEYQAEGANPLVGSVGVGVALVERFADALIPLAIQYSAGFAQYWYDTVNSPPYLRKVQVSQHAIPLEATDEQGHHFIAYQARWKNQLESMVIKRSRRLTKSTQSLLEFLDACTSPFDTDWTSFFYSDRWHLSEELLPTYYVSYRKLAKDSPSQPLYNHREMEVKLTFSEPIRPPLEENSGFQVGFEPLSMAAPITLLDLAQLDIVNTDPEGVLPHMEGSEWTVTIPAELLSGVRGLNGGVKLVVYAKDRNYHLHPDNQGESLDTTPHTPAKINAISEDGYPKFSWHTQESIPMDAYCFGFGIFCKGAFAYDEEGGDRNHILWFSHQDSVSIEPEDNGDIISISSVPVADKP